jgi:hypothetical protein
MCEIKETEKQLIEILSDGCQHSWYSLCENINQRPPVITTALIGLIGLGKIEYSVTQKDLFYFLAN